jgi:MFS family permease
MARKWWTLITVSIATFMLLLDVTIVNVALPDIGHELKASLTDLQWVVDSYVLALAALTLLAGALADRLGRKLVFSAGLAGFTLASLLAGFSSDALTLNLARGLQGIGGAAMFGTVLARSRRSSLPASARPRSGSGARPSAWPSRSGRSSAASWSTPSAGSRSSSSTCRSALRRWRSH